MYHGFGDRDRQQDLNDLFMPVPTFERQLRTLDRWFRPLDLAGFLDACRSGSWPSRSVLVTIDDGYVSTLEDAAPLLAAYGVPAVVFVCPGRLGATSSWTSTMREERLLDREQVRELASLGIEIGVHGMDHARMVAMSAHELHKHTVEARSQLARIIGREPAAFAYPYGEFDHAAVAAVRAAGYEVGFAVEHDQDLYTVRRHNVNSYDSWATFALKALPQWDSAMRMSASFPRLRGTAARLAGRRR